VYFWWSVLEKLRILHRRGVSLCEESHEPQAQEVSKGNKNDRIEFVIFYYMMFNILLIMFASKSDSRNWDSSSQNWHMLYWFLHRSMLTTSNHRFYVLLLASNLIFKILLPTTYRKLKYFCTSTMFKILLLVSNLMFKILLPSTYH
jgi:hypothetical protein